MVPGIPSLTAKAMNVQHSRYKYMDDLLELDGCGTPAGKPRWPTGSSPIVFENWIPILNATSGQALL